MSQNNKLISTTYLLPLLLYIAGCCDHIIGMMLTDSDLHRGDMQQYYLEQERKLATMRRLQELEYRQLQSTSERQVCKISWCHFIKHNTHCSTHRPLVFVLIFNQCFCVYCCCCCTGWKPLATTCYLLAMLWAGVITKFLEPFLAFVFNHFMDLFFLLLLLLFLLLLCSLL